MADDTKPTAPKNETPKAETPKAETARAPATQSRIVKQGRIPAERFAIEGAVDASLAGQYRITHGSMHFGYEKDDKGNTVGPLPIAHVGAVVELTAADAAAALANGTIVRVNAAA